MIIADVCSPCSIEKDGVRARLFVLPTKVRCISCGGYWGTDGFFHHTSVMDAWAQSLEDE